MSNTKTESNRICDDLISLINSEVTSPLVRFLKSEERTMSDDELCEKFEVYNIFIYLTHTKKRGSKPTIHIYIGENFYYQLLGSKLSYEVEKSLRSFGRSASKVLYNHFLNESKYLGKIRFDLITNDKNNFFIPNINWNENIYIYDDIVKANSQRSLFGPDDKYRITLQEYEKEVTSDDDAIAAFRAMATSVQKK